MACEGKIYQLIPKVSMEIGAVTKDGKNQQQGYKFRGIDAVMTAVHGPMMKNGIFCTTEVSEWSQQERESRGGGALFYTSLKMKVTFHADDGSSVSTTTWGEAMDSADKSSNKAMSAALKYALFQTFMIPTEETEDADSITHEVEPRRAPARPAETYGHGDKMSPEQASFNQWIDPYVQAGTIAGDRVRQIVIAARRDYKEARRQCELEMQPKR